MRILRVAIAIAALAVPLAAQTPGRWCHGGGVGSPARSGRRRHERAQFPVDGQWRPCDDGRRGRGHVLAGRQHGGGDLHDQRVLPAGGAVGASERVRSRLWRVGPVRAGPAVLVLRAPAGRRVPHPGTARAARRQTSWRGPRTRRLTRWTTTGRSLNTLSVEVGADQVRFLVNGTEVSSQPKSALHSDGITGVRVNHLLNVHIDDLDLGG